MSSFDHIREQIAGLRNKHTGLIQADALREPAADTMQALLEVAETGDAVRRNFKAESYHCYGSVDVAIFERFRKALAKLEKIDG